MVNVTKISDITLMKKEELVEYLSSTGMTGIEEMKRPELVERAKNLFLNNAPVLGVEELEETVELFTPQAQQTVAVPHEDQKIIPTRPERGSVEWTDYVLSQLYDHEKPNGKPKAEGLRRIFPKVLGPIIESDVEIVAAAGPQTDGRATAIFRMRYHDPDYGLVSRADAADAHWTNCGKPFSHHPTATATTMAEGRCLRKALNINVLIEEETLGHDDNPTSVSFMTQNQSDVIQNVANKLNIDIKALLKHLNINVEHFETKLMTEYVTLQEAQLILQTLSAYKKNVNDAGYIRPPAEIVKTSVV